MRILFWLLDINYEMVGGIPEIRLWGITDKDERVVVLDRSFRPYFYALLEKDAEPDEVKERILKREIIKKYILSISLLEKKFFGQPVKVLKITCKEPPLIPKIRDEVKQIRGIKDVLEADIRFYMRYMIDNDVYPCSWHEIEVEEIPNKFGWQVNRVFLAKSTPKLRLDIQKLPKLTVYAFDIECYNVRGEPDPERDPIIILSRVFEGIDKKIITAKDKDDKELLREFVSDIEKLDPDIIVGYNNNRFDWPYLIERSKKEKVKLRISRAGGVPAQSVYGHFSIVGRANVDMYDFAEETYEVKVKTLENIADYLGVFPKEKRTKIEKSEIYKYWDDKEKRNKLLKYAMEDAESTYGIAEKILPFAIQLSAIVGLPLDQVGTASVGYRVEWHLMRQAFKYGELIPNKVERPYERYKGAIVLKPKPGIHENIAVLDFSSMYPNIMIKMNISPDTYVPPGTKVNPDEVNIAPEVNHRFRKEPPGFYKKVLQRLLKARNSMRKEMKKIDPRSPQYRILNERQRALKVIANATYGYCGWIGARWYKREVAEATTAWGRKLIKEAIKIARELGLEVIYGDTDSLFIRYNPEKVKKFMHIVEDRLGFDIKVDKVYQRVFFTEAKKRYCGLLEDGRVDVVGLEAVRGDWSELAKEIQEKVIDIILREGKPDKAVKYIREIINKLRNGEIPLEKLVIWKTLSKKIEEYEVDIAHVRVAKMLMRAGYKISKGEKIGYIICKEGEKLAEKAKPYIFVKDYSDVDVDYYIQKQILPVALRVLKYFGVTEQQILKGEKQASILEFFGA